LKKRRDLKLKAIEYKGGKCNRCGYYKSVYALQFHHIDPAEKDFNIGQKGSTRAWATVKAELDKCVLLCANCHFEEHERLNKPTALS
jgi:5-methylcytosine-specific restriction endonuclease McrA